MGHDGPLASNVREAVSVALGDGVRRNVATISQEERNRLRDAIIALQQRLYPGNRNDVPFPVKSRSFCNFLQALSLLYRSMSIAPSTSRSWRSCSSSSRMS